MYILLGRKRKTIREIARLSLLANPNNPEMAIKLASEEIRAKSIVSSILISLAIKLAIALIMYWIKNRISSPSLTYLSEEPGN